MSVELTFGAALIVGLLGSSHCLGMCGGIVSALNMGVVDNLGERPRSLFGYQLAYNMGRIGSYVLVGLAAGSLGAELAQLGISPLAGRLVAAFFMIALGLYLADWWRGLALLERLGARLWRHIQPLGQRLFPIQNPGQAFLLGALWGWLPCGLVYSTLIWAATAQNALHSSSLMFAFGIGTLPAMLTTGLLAKQVQTLLANRNVQHFAGLLILLFGLYTIPFRAIVDI